MILFCSMAFSVMFRVVTLDTQFRPVQETVSMSDSQDFSSTLLKYLLTETLTIRILIKRAWDRLLMVFLRTAITP